MVNWKKLMMTNNNAHQKYDRHQRWMKPKRRRLLLMNQGARFKAVVNVTEALSVWNRLARYGTWRT